MHFFNPRPRRPLLAGLAFALVLLAGCTDSPTAPEASRLAPTDLSAATEVTVYRSGSHVTAWDPIFPTSVPANWTSTTCTEVPPVGPDADWVNPHNAFVSPTHPWESSEQGSFDAAWINAWPGYNSIGPGGHSWTKYRTTISGKGDYVVQFLADNCSWIYLDDNLVGVQHYDWWNRNTGKYPVSLSGQHQLTFIVYDGGGLAGGKFRLETRKSFIDNGGDTGVLPEPPKPSDDTPPAITADVAGTLGENGWYTSDVTVKWTVKDPESSVGSTSGCDVATVDTDTGAADFTCEATSAGGAASATITVRRDATAPAIAFSGNEGTYTVDATVAISCTAADAMSGLGASDCPEANGDAHTFPLGTSTLSATAIDNAGNGAAASASFEVRVTTGSLCALVERWVSRKGVAHSMCKQLENQAIRAFHNHVRGQTGKSVSAEHAAILHRLADGL